MIRAMLRTTKMWLLLSMFLSLSSSLAQVSGSQNGTATANYCFAKPNDLTIVVDVIGAVQRPGRYEIVKGINLINLMALAGGAASDGTLDDIKITRFLEAQGKITKTEFHVDLEDIVKVNASLLDLHPDDVIQVERSGWSSFREGIGIVVSAAIITGAVAQVIYATKR